MCDTVILLICMLNVWATGKPANIRRLSESLKPIAWDSMCGLVPFQSFENMFRKFNGMRSGVSRLAILWVFFLLESGDVTVSRYKIWVPSC